MNSGDHNTGTRDAALARVFAYRARIRAKVMPVRVTIAVLGVALLIVSIPMIVLLPEFGIPALLVAFRLLAVEAEWAARAYAWTDWRFSQMSVWFHRQSRPARAAILIGLLVVAVGLVWLIVVEFV
jgi:hypothetical protein